LHRVAQRGGPQERDDRGDVSRNDGRGGHGERDEPAGGRLPGGNRRGVQIDFFACDRWSELFPARSVVTRKYFPQSRKTPGETFEPIRLSSWLSHEKTKQFPRS